VNLFLAGEFVLAMEPDVVAAHVEVAYADLMRKLYPDAETGALGWRFLEKIVQLPLSLPAVDGQLDRYVRALLGMPAVDERERVLSYLGGLLEPEPVDGAGDGDAAAGEPDLPSRPAVRQRAEWPVRAWERRRAGSDGTRPSVPRRGVSAARTPRRSRRSPCRPRR